MDGLSHAGSVSDGLQVVSLQRDRVFGHYAVIKYDPNSLKINPPHSFPSQLYLKCK
jgi:hypothetical protein